MSELIRRYPAASKNSFAGIVLLLLAVPALIWWQSIEDLSIYIDYETPPGQVYYIFSKLAGMYGVFLLWLQVILALLKRTAVGDKLLFFTIKFHRNLGITAFSFLILHASLFVIAVSIRKAHFAYGLLLPNFNNGFYSLAVTFGVIALYGLVIVIIAGYLRKRGFQKTKWLHRISILALTLTLVHCLLIGTETRYFIMASIYAFMICALIFVLYLFYTNSLSARKSSYS